MRREFLWLTAGYLAGLIVTHWQNWTLFWYLCALAPIFILGLYDFTQQKHTILRNFPVLGHFRYLLEMVRPEIQQYFIESNTDGKPLSRQQRSVIYQRAKKQLDTLPFGTQKDVYEIGYEWVNHSLAPKLVNQKRMRVTIGQHFSKYPYCASILNVSAMSYGSLSSRAIECLNGAALLGKFAHNTGEGGISDHHLRHGGDLIWQIGTGYFGARNHDGTFDPALYKENSQRPEVKMIELKLSQGAKPGHGGILPGVKVTKEISRIRNVPLGQDVISPPTHSTFSTPVELLEFVARLRENSGGKPVGIKLCLGRRIEFLSICKAIVNTGIAPDYISVDGGEGGTGAAPLEFSNSIGSPLFDALIFIDNAVRGIGYRDRIKIISAGKVTNGFDVVKHLGLGADLCSSARAMMIALGCIQALRCNTNHCPTGVATTRPELVRGIHIPDKIKRVQQYHHETVASAAEIIGAIGLDAPEKVRPFHLMRRIAPSVVKEYAQLYPRVATNALVDQGEMPPIYQKLWNLADHAKF
jgi:glutamate synthase domain-containing protein 2